MYLVINQFICEIEVDLMMVLDKSRDYIKITSDHGSKNGKLKNIIHPKVNQANKQSSRKHTL